MDRREVFTSELGKIARGWRTRFDNELKGLNLTCSRALALACLARAGEPMTQTNLAMELGIENPSCVRLVDGLQSRNLVDRQAVGEDRRANYVVLTKAGVLLADRVATMMAALRNQFMRGIDPKDLSVATRVLSVIAINLQETAVNAGSKQLTARGKRRRARLTSASAPSSRYPKSQPGRTPRQF